MRIRSSYIWAIIIAAGVTFWMVSDTVFPQLNEKQASADVEDSPLEEPEMALTVTAIKVRNEVTPIKIRGNGVTRTKFEIDVFARRNMNEIKDPIKDFRAGVTIRVPSADALSTINA